uniref:Sushi domain-containing protein n=1 Tax=Cyprinus carpio TaxID=7962 RepID=A0A8C2A7B5_CYPCA
MERLPDIEGPKCGACGVCLIFLFLEEMCVTKLTVNMRLNGHPGSGSTSQGQNKITCHKTINAFFVIFFFFSSTEVTCEGEQLINVDIVVGNPGKAPPYKPGHILVFRCTDVKLKMHGQQVIECLSNGKWDYPYPKCGDVTCLLNTKKENIKMDRFPDFECPVTPGYNLTFSCNGQGLILKGQREITCQSNGEWSSPFPKCHTTSCGPPPDVNDADTIELKKHEYNTGERVEYSCFNKYTLDLRPPFSRYLTCEQGEWRGTIKGIELAYVNPQKMFAPHNDYITFACQRGKDLVGVRELRQQCNDGVITLPECVRRGE